MSIARPKLGHGVGLRPKHFPLWLSEKPAVDWVEATSENYLTRGGRPYAVLEKVRAEMPVVLHGVSLSIGGMDPLNDNYLRSLSELISRIDPVMVTDHLCWGTQGGRYVHDLWPLPYTEEALAHVVSRVQQVQDQLGRQISLENVSSYVAFHSSTMTEWEFLAEIAERADCGVLLDINNIYVSAKNHHFDPEAYLAGIPSDRVVQFHLAGHQNRGTYLLDTHDAPVPDPVWELYRSAVVRYGAVPTLVEWDDHIPELDVLIAQSQQAANIEREGLARVSERGAA